MKGSAALTAALVVLMAAPTAGASSIVYIRDSNVWVTDARQFVQVTRDGTAQNPYENPSQADDGTIVATRGPGDQALIYRMTHGGRLLGAPFRPGQFEYGISEANVSPDGTKVGYQTGFGGDSSCTPGSRGTTPCFIFLVTSAAGPQNLGGSSFPLDGAWLGNGTYVGDHGSGSIYFYNVGAQDAEFWFNQIRNCSGCDGNLLDPDVAGNRIVFNETSFGSTELSLATASGPPPASVTHTRCRLRDPTNGPPYPGGRFFDPSLAPGGGAVVWGEGTGLWASAITGTSAENNCGMTRTFFTPGAEPDWGPAPLGGAPGGGGGGGGAVPAARLSGEKTLTSDGRTVAFRLSCPGPVACTGTASLRTAKKVSVSARKRVLSLGRKRYSIRAGARKRVRIKLNRKARKLLRKRRRLAARLTTKSTTGAKRSVRVTIRRKRR